MTCKLCSKSIKKTNRRVFCSDNCSQKYDGKYSNRSFRVRFIQGKNRKIGSYKTVRTVCDRDNWKCVWCFSSENLELDHITASVRGGDNTIRNLRLLCKKCHIIRHNPTVKSLKECL